MSASLVGSEMCIRDRHLLLVIAAQALLCSETVRRGRRGSRLLHGLDPVGKAFCRHLWSRCTLGDPPRFAYGFIEHRRRESAMLVHGTT
eukprot:12314132-Alexandrium_andersonii.AAC.1